jgi:alkanesulfonate monooxygenase SsuD/methylene tetrahydromethanopterin reductase-like flavin-dependent oxidoreductase (luciferase family)
VVKFGAALWARGGDWSALAAAARAAEAAGFDSLWTDDHVVNDLGPIDEPVFEGWTTLAAWAAQTTRPTLGLMVGAGPFRHPVVVAKMATTIDHISGGRAIVGLGAGWFRPEFEMFGFPYGSKGQLNDQFDEAIPLVRRLLDGEHVTHDGAQYSLRDARIEPRAIQARLPLLIGGSGPKRTLRTVARWADAWNTSGTVETYVERDAILSAHCVDVGRDDREIERTVMAYPAVRDDSSKARDLLETTLRRFAMEFSPGKTQFGTADEVAAMIRPYLDAGVQHFIWAFYPPFDLETLGRLGEIRRLLER